MTNTETGTAVTVMERDPALAAREQVAGLIRPVAPPSEVLAAQNETRELLAKALENGRDYGAIPGTEKPTLLKPGAERLAAAFGCFPRYRIIEREVDHDREVAWSKRHKKWNNRHQGDRTFTWIEQAGTSRGLYRYVVECELVHRASGVVIGQGIGSCSSMESRYVDRPRDCENTVVKIGQKRALVGTVLNTFGLSDQFTQDVEDLVEPAETAAAVAAPVAEAPTTDVERASPKQIGFGKKLLQSGVFTDAERKAFSAHFDRATKAEAKDLIDRIQAQLTARKGTPAREPGADDVDDAA